MKIFKNSKELDRTFYTTLILKAAHSTLEIIGGILFLIISPQSISHLAHVLTQHELSEDPKDFIASRILKVSNDFSHPGSRYFAAAYLLSHGLVKILVIIALFKEKLWAYPTMIVVLSGFIIYQLYRINIRFSIGLTILTLFDLFIIWLTLKEYKRHKVRLAAAAG